MSTYLPYESAASIVEKGGVFHVEDLRYGVAHTYKVQRGVKCFVVLVVMYGRDHYIGNIHYGAANRFKHGGPKVEFGRAHEVFRTFDRAWRRYLHPEPPIPDIRDEIRIQAVTKEG